MVRYADRAANVKPSTIREILHLTQQSEVISFAGGLPASDLFPIGRMREAADRVLSDAANLQYSITEGEVRLRELLAWQSAELADPSNFLVVSGSQQGLDLAGKLFVNPGDAVVVEAPTYLGALRAFDVYQATYVAVPSDGEGIEPSGVEQAFRNGARFLYLNPNFSNPTGRTMSERRRHQIVDLAEEFDAIVYEDDPYALLRFSGEFVPPMITMSSSNVLYAGSFSKILVPGLRLGWLSGPVPMIEKLTMIKQAADLHTSTTTQALAAEALADGFLERHVLQVRAYYLVQRDRMLQALTAHFPPGTTWTVPEGGMFIWVTLPVDLDATSLLSQAVAEGVAYVPGAQFFPNGGGSNTLRLAYSVATLVEIDQGIERLGRLIARSTS
ncbi:MAG: PLP-dependent aminotransferase family protein [Acidimicrobiia bacterium]|nr:PLP-dependent aminotransferase family protein [Acidimicrobiia bacterium]MDH5502763.1 PLP-dependent aminotransferase family protein [Acidimicrobiia bacterium]